MRVVILSRGELAASQGRDAFVVMPLQTTRLLVREFLTGAQTVTGRAAGRGAYFRPETEVR